MPRGFGLETTVFCADFRSALGTTATISPTDSTSRKESSTRSSAGRPPTGIRTLGPRSPIRRPSPAPARITARSIDLPFLLEREIDRLAQGLGRKTPDRGFRCGAPLALGSLFGRGRLALRDQRRPESQTHRLLEAPVHLRHRPQLSAQAHLSHRHEIGRKRNVAEARRERQRQAQVRGGLLQPDAARHVHEHVRARERKPGALLQYSNHDREPAYVHALRDPLWIGKVRGRDERLHLDEERTRAFERGHHRRAGNGAAPVAKEPSLVTCPISTTGSDRSLARRRSLSPHSRTWVTLPGAAFTPGRYRVWMESM